MKLILKNNISSIEVIFICILSILSAQPFLFIMLNAQVLFEKKIMIIFIISQMPHMLMFGSLNVESIVTNYKIGQYPKESFSLINSNNQAFGILFLVSSLQQTQNGYKLFVWFSQRVFFMFIFPPACISHIR